MTEQTVSDYDLVGGGPAVARVVDGFYERVTADPDLAHYFEGVDLNRLKRHQALLVSQVMGGPTAYDGRELGVAHARLGITDEAFDRVVAHLAATLQEAGAPADVIGRVGGALGGTRSAIVTDAPGAPGAPGAP